MGTKSTSPERHTFNLNMNRATQRLTQLGDLYTAIVQLAANSYDARSPIFHVFWEKQDRTLIVLDNGHGILGEIPQKDLDELDFFTRFSEDISKEKNPFTEFKKLTSALSFHYMMKSAGLSVKSFPSYWQKLIDIVAENEEWRSKDEYDEPQGTLGIGFLEPFGFSSKITVISRPSLRLAQEHYDRRFDSFKDVPVFKLEPEFDFENNKLTYSVSAYDDAFVMPFANRKELITQGTMTIIEDVENNVSIDRIVDTLSSTFGLIIGSGRFSIQVHTVHRDRRARRQNQHSLRTRTVPAQSLKGKSLMLKGQETLTFREGEYVAKVSLYDVGKEGQISAPCFVRRGVIAGVVTKMDYFVDAWHHKRLTGTVEIMTPAEDTNLWDARKQYPVMRNKSLLQLVKQVAALEPAIAARFQEIDQERAQSRMKSIQDLASQALAESLSQTDYFGDLDIFQSDVSASVQEKKGDKSKPSSSTPSPTSRYDENTSLRIQIINEHGESSGHDIDFAVKHDFGHYYDGTTQKGKFAGLAQDLGKAYPLEIVLTNLRGASLQLGQSDTIAVEKNPGQNILTKVYLITGEPPKPQPLSGVKVVLVGFGSEEDPWDASSLRTQGIIHVNIDYAPLQGALERNDYRSTAYIIAEASTMALATSVYTELTPNIMKRTQWVIDFMAYEMIDNWNKSTRLG